MAASSAPLAPWRGCATLQFHCGAEGNTQLQGGAQAPLKLLRHFNGSDGRCDVPLLHTAGGLVGGDELAITLDAQPHSRGLISSVAAQKIYGSRERSRLQPQGRWASIQLQASLSAGASLEWMPQETVLFGGALLEQQQHIELASDASWLGVEVVRLGRTARGEQLGNGCWRSALSIRRQQRWLLVDRLELEGNSLSSIHGLAGQPVFASLVWAAPEALTASSIEPLLEQCRADRAELPGEMAIGLLEPGLIARYRGPSTQAARFWFFRIWRRIRSLQQQQAPSWPRYWPFQEQALALTPTPAAATTTAAP